MKSIQLVIQEAYDELSADEGSSVASDIIEGLVEQV